MGELVSRFGLDLDEEGLGGRGEAGGGDHGIRELPSQPPRIHSAPAASGTDQGKPSARRSWSRPQVVSRRFVKKQPMQGTLRRAHLLMQARTKVLHGEWDDVFRRWYPRFRPHPQTQTPVRKVAAALDIERVRQLPPSTDLRRLFFHRVHRLVAAIPPSSSTTVSSKLLPTWRAKRSRCASIPWI